MYRYTKENLVSADGEESGWVMQKPIIHGFSEIPLITKRGEVAWNNVQNIIESCTLCLMLLKRYGWGLYIKLTKEDSW